MPLYKVGCIRVTHPCAGRHLVQAPMLPLDLHVLSLPLAFILSQDQTLHCNYISLFFSSRSSIWISKVILTKFFLFYLALSLYLFLNLIYCVLQYVNELNPSYPDTKKIHLTNYKKLNVSSFFINSIFFVNQILLLKSLSFQPTFERLSSVWGDKDKTTFLTIKTFISHFL